MPITVVFVSKVPYRKKLMKQFKSRATADKAIQALSAKFKYTFYSPKSKKQKARVRRSSRKKFY
jgi:hypothetical protein